MFLTACIQLRCTTEMERNFQALEHHCLQASKYGAQLIATPENSIFLGPQFHKVDLAQSLQGTNVQRLQALAAKCEAYLLVGSIPEERILPDGQKDTEKCYNTSILLSPTGELICSYRKIHLFDVDIPGGLSIAESDTIAPGSEVVVGKTPLAKIGMSICYDLRFPELYRAHMDRGADILAIPSAFTLTTGKDHWHALLRARAIETQCWVLAPAQWGTHDAGGQRKSYGHSLIIDPWGTIVGDKGDGEGMCLAEIDLDYTAKVRQSIPLRNHRRL